MYTWTAFVEWSDVGICEEIDVKATWQESAKRLVEADLIENYEPGWRIIELIRRPHCISHLA